MLEIPPEGVSDAWRGEVERKVCDGNKLQLFDRVVPFAAEVARQACHEECASQENLPANKATGFSNVGERAYLYFQMGLFAELAQEGLGHALMFIGAATWQGPYERLVCVPPVATQ